MNLTKYKYPRTVHLPYSPMDVNSDDKKLANDNHFKDKEVIVTLKLDGENTTIYPDGSTHARSINSAHHISRSWVKAFAAQLNLPDSIRVCGENMWAEHSIPYTDLSTYFYGFSVWSGDQCADWDSTIKLFEDCGITPVPVIYRGKYDANKILEIFEDYELKHEGFVVRTNQKFLYIESGFNVAKYVKEDFKPGNQHWLSKAIKQNGLIKNGYKNLETD